MNHEKHLLLRAIDEITQLRLANQILGAKVEVMEIFRDAIRGPDRHGLNTCQEDIVYRLRERVAELDVASGNSREAQQHL